MESTAHRDPRNGSFPRPITGPSAAEALNGEGRASARPSHGTGILLAGGSFRRRLVSVAGLTSTVVATIRYLIVTLEPTFSPR